MFPPMSTWLIFIKHLPTQMYIVPERKKGDLTPPQCESTIREWVHLSPPSRSFDVCGSVNRPRSVTAPRLKTFPTPDRFRHRSPFSSSREQYLENQDRKVVRGRTLVCFLIYDCTGPDVKEKHDAILFQLLSEHLSGVSFINFPSKQKHSDLQSLEP